MSPEDVVERVHKQIESYRSKRGNHPAQDSMALLMHDQTWEMLEDYAEWGLDAPAIDLSLRTVYKMSVILSREVPIGQSWFVMSSSHPDLTALDSSEDAYYDIHHTTGTATITLTGTSNSSTASAGLFQQSSTPAYWGAAGGGGGGSGGTWSGKKLNTIGVTIASKSFMITPQGIINLKITLADGTYSVYDWGPSNPKIVNKDKWPHKIEVMACTGGTYILTENELNDLTKLLQMHGKNIDDQVVPPMYASQQGSWHIDQATGDLISVKTMGLTTSQINNGYGFSVLHHDSALNKNTIATQKGAVFTLTNEEFYILNEQWQAFLKKDKHHIENPAGKYQVSKSQFDKIKAIMVDYEIFNASPPIGLSSKKAKKEADEAFEKIKVKENKEKVKQNKKKLEVLFGDLDQYSAIPDSKLPLFSPPNGALAINTKDEPAHKPLSEAIKDKFDEINQDGLLDELISKSLPPITAKTWLSGDLLPEDQWGIPDPLLDTSKWTFPPGKWAFQGYPGKPLSMEAFAELKDKLIKKAKGMNE